MTPPDVPASPARQAIRAGDAKGALALLQEQVRGAPADPRLRTFLFQLLAVLGQWDRALKQLAVARELDAGTEPMVCTYREAIQCEPLRQQVFAGKKVPLLLGEPEPWAALMIEALLREGQDDHAAGAGLRARALEQSTATPGSANGQRFEWFADADTRLGPMLEAVLQGRYYWIPFSRLSRMTLEAPVDLRDVVWTPAQLQFTNGGESVALVPTRYAGTPLDGDGALALARRTEWRPIAGNQFAGQGQRIFASDLEEYPILELREVVFDPSPEKSA
jgi:type VI secretion system protein ImpE